MKKKPEVLVSIPKKAYKKLVDIAWAECEQLHGIGGEDCEKESEELQEFLNDLEAKVK